MVKYRQMKIFASRLLSCRHCKPHGRYDEEYAACYKENERPSQKRYVLVVIFATLIKLILYRV